ncbi:MAG: alpha/beta fold hydrolase [Saprospiraceae bacterium]|nr:alpha/beta fold hydrolase [Saprospiraceae bacterium]
MRTKLLPLLFFISIFMACSKKDPAPREVKSYTIEQFINTTVVNGGSFSHDDSKILISSDKSGIFNAYTLSVQGGEMTPLTSSENASVYALSFFPEDDRFLYMMDNNGDELFQLYVQEAHGSTRSLTPDKGARASFQGWADDRKSFFYTSTKRDPKFEDLYEMDIASMTAKLIYQNEEAYDISGISNDKKTLVLGKPVNTNDSDIFLYTLADGSIKKVNTALSGNQFACFSDDGSQMYFMTDEGEEYKYLVKYELADGTKETVFKTEWDVWFADFSKSGKYFIMGINEDGKTVVRVTNADSGKALDFPKFESGDITGITFSDSEKWVRFYVSSSASPSNLYTMNLETGEHFQLTQNLNPEITPDDLVLAEVVRYPSFDSLDIPAIYYKPLQASKDSKVPALIWVHGGPGGQSRQNYSALIQYLVNHGYAVLAVNNRGSSGYGKTFYQMDDQDHGEGDLKDCIWGKKWMQEQDYIDTSKVGIIGGSYGGFMVMRALTHTPNEFALGVNIFGVTNWLRTLKSIPPWWESFKEALYKEMGDPVADSLRLYGISPVFHGNKVTKPTMVLQGAKDPRVLQVESDEMVAAVKANGVPVEYLIFEDEGHGFVKKENQIKGYGSILTFLDEHLKGEKKMKE